MFRHLYDSPLLATLLPAVVALVVLVAAQWQRGFGRAFGSVFAVGIAADAWLNGPWTPVPSATATATAVGVFFVIFGDFRYFVIVEHTLANKNGLVRAAGWAFVVPVASQLVRWSYPRIEHDERSTFLLYELLFLCLAIGTWLFRLPLPRASASARFARRATVFELGQYGVWIAADVGLMKTGHDAFYGVRLIANLMYYVAFVPTMLRLLPRDART